MRSLYFNSGGVFASNKTGNKAHKETKKKQQRVLSGNVFQKQRQRWYGACLLMQRTFVPDWDAPLCVLSTPFMLPTSPTLSAGPCRTRHMVWKAMGSRVRTNNMQRATDALAQVTNVKERAAARDLSHVMLDFRISSHFPL